MCCSQHRLRVLSHDESFFVRRPRSCTTTPPHPNAVWRERGNPWSSQLQLHRRHACSMPVCEDLDAHGIVVNGWESLGRDEVKIESG
jgi:hypothetical protein